MGEFWGNFPTFAPPITNGKNTKNMGLSYRLSKKSRAVSDHITAYEVMARFHVGSIDQYARTAVYVPSSFTDSNGNKRITFQDGNVVVPKIKFADAEQVMVRDMLVDAKAQLSEICVNVEQAFDTLQRECKQPYKGWLQDVINGVADGDGSPSSEKTMLETLDDFINSGMLKVSKGTLTRYRTLLHILMRYEEQENVTLAFDELTPDLLNDIRDFIAGNGNDTQRSENYVVSLFRTFRTFIRWANGMSKDYRIEPLTNNNPFDNFSIGSEQYGTPFYLTLDERNRLAEAELPPRLARQRDIFIFQCLIGCRVGDLWTMTKESIIDGAVEYIPRKTKDGRPVTVRVPLNDRAKAIIDRYKDNGDPRLFPFVAQQQYNEDIKEMLKLAKIDRMVTVLNPVTKEEEKKPIYEVASSHMARRTFIGNLYKQVKDPNLVGKLSGHTENSKAFARYRDIDEDIAKELVSMLE